MEFIALKILLFNSLSYQFSSSKIKSHFKNQTSNNFFQEISSYLCFVVHNCLTTMDNTYTSIYSNRYHDTSKRFQGFFKLVMVWKGSVLKLIWHDLAIFIFLHTFLRILYTQVLIHHDVAAQYFEMICIYAGR